MTLHQALPICRSGRNRPWARTLKRRASGVVMLGGGYGELAWQGTSGSHRRWRACLQGFLTGSLIRRSTHDSYHRAQPWTKWRSHRRADSAWKRTDVRPGGDQSLKGAPWTRRRGFPHQKPADSAGIAAVDRGLTVPEGSAETGMISIGIEPNALR